MTRERAILIVQQVIQDQMDITPGSYKLEDRIETLGGDSLTMVEMFNMLEDRLQLTHLEGSEKLDKIERISDVVDIVEKATTTIQ